jgi:hypothetical protein
MKKNNMRRIIQIAPRVPWDSGMCYNHIVLYWFSIANKLQQMWCFKITQIYSPTFLGARRVKSVSFGLSQDISRLMFPLVGSRGESLSLPFPSTRDVFFGSCSLQHLQISLCFHHIPFLLAKFPSTSLLQWHLWFYWGPTQKI